MNSNEQVKRFLDDAGKVMRWPKKKADQLDVLKYLRTKFESGRKYTEKEINVILDTWHCFGDRALLRRMMFDLYLLERTPDGREYWIE